MVGHFFGCTLPPLPSLRFFFIFIFTFNGCVASDAVDTVNSIEYRPTAMQSRKKKTEVEKNRNATMLTTLSVYFSFSFPLLLLTKLMKLTNLMCYRLCLTYCSIFDDVCSRARALEPFFFPCLSIFSLCMCIRFSQFKAYLKNVMNGCGDVHRIQAVHKLSLFFSGCAPAPCACSGERSRLYFMSHK